MNPKPFTLADDGELRWRASDIADWLDDLQRHPRKARLRGAATTLANRNRPKSLRQEEVRV